MEQRVYKASEFKAKCLKLMDEINETGETIMVTKNGRPVAEVRPAVRKRKSLFGAHKGLIEIHGDLDDAPAMEWEMTR